jgi:uncharacterized membrane protein YbhN (UPF0104 family)
MDNWMRYMDRKQLRTGLSEIGIGIILYISAIELYSILIINGTTELIVFFIKVISYILLVIGIITSIMAVVPESKKEQKKLIWEKKKEDKKEK